MGRCRERTLGGIACLVVLGEPTKINVLYPRNPLLVLLVIGSLSPLHCEEYQIKLCGICCIVYRLFYLAI
jgi:hypothetical protein